MTYYYRVDVTNPKGTMGGSEYVTAPSKAEARRAYLESHPEMVEWTIEITKVTKESSPMTDIPVLVLPSISELVPGADDENPDPNQRDEYTAQCNALIFEALRASPGRRIKTQYPWDTTEPGNDSRDEVVLTVQDRIEVVDFGAHGAPTAPTGTP